MGWEWSEFIKKKCENKTKKICSWIICEFFFIKYEQILYFSGTLPFHPNCGASDTIMDTNQTSKFKSVVWGGINWGVEEEK